MRVYPKNLSVVVKDLRAVILNSIQNPLIPG
jgi:hypothetical protein